MSDRSQPSPAAAQARRRYAYASTAWALALAVLMLGPALLPGYVLSRDMVWVPDLALRRDVVGLGTALPRAVPSDAVVAVLDDLLGGMVLQKIALFGALAGAGAGAAALVGGRMPRRLVAVSVAVWNPFVAERLWMGHWPVLLGYAAIPWLAVLGRSAARSGRLPAALPLVLLLGSLSANAGLVSALTVLVTGARGRGTTLKLLVACAAANAPWIAAGLVHGGLAQEVGGYRLFATHGDARPAPLAAVGLAGIWNADVVPASQTGVLAWIWLAALVGLGAIGMASWWRRTGRRQAAAYLALWLVGIGLAVLSWLAPGMLAAIGRSVPGGGLFRDGSRSLGLVLPLTVSVVCEGAGRLAGGVPRRAARGVLWFGCAALPLMTMPDAAGGLAGALHAVAYPGDLLAARNAIGGGRGTALLLPWSANQAPSWNGGRTVLDPMARLLRVGVVADDSLVVDGITVAGEDPSARGAARALAHPTPATRAAALRAMGVRWVVIEADTGITRGTVPAISGDAVHAGPLVTVLRLSGDVAQERPDRWRIAAVGAGWAAFLGLGALGVLLPLRGGLRKWHRRRGAGANVLPNG